MKMLVGAMVGGLAMAASAPAATIERSFNGGAVKRLMLEKAAGHVAITAAADGRATVTAKQLNYGKECRLTIELVQGVLTVEVKQEGLFLRSQCEVDFAISVPREVAVEVKSDSGDLQMRGIKGAVVYRLGSGAVDLLGEITSLQGRSGNGPVRVNGLTGSTDLALGSGSVTATYAKEPKQGRFAVKTGHGNTTVFLPAGSRVRTDYTSGSGKLNSEFADSPNAPFTIGAKVGSGDLSVKKSL